MPKRLFVGGLPWNVDDEGLADMFHEFAIEGELKDYKVLTDRDTGRSRGFGFVTFSDESDADKAIEQMNKRKIEGRELTVNVANARKRNEDSASYGGR
ncbi:MAG: RNA-binding protein [Myxococcota bacterium]